VEVQEHYGEIRARGADAVAIGQGTGEEAARFCRRMNTDYPCLGDPGKDAYRAFGLRRDGWWNVTGRPFLEAPGLAWRRLRRASLRGSLMQHTDVLQLGGTAIVDRSGIVRYLHRARKTDDRAPAPEILAALDRLSPPAGEPPP
jgi:peroxiredoxin